MIWWVEEQFPKNPTTLFMRKNKNNKTKNINMDFL